MLAIAVYQRLLAQLSFFANLLSAILLNAILLIPTLLSATP
jgi:hypothetical protein